MYTILITVSYGFIGELKAGRVFKTNIS